MDKWTVATINNSIKQAYFGMMGLLLGVLLSGCGSSPNDEPLSPKTPQKNLINASEQALLGCYSVEKSAPAQMMISHNDGKFTMQMKEPTGEFDAPEGLSVIGVDEVWQRYAVNALGLKKDDIEAALVRDDDVMALVKVRDEALLNPQIDSPFVMNLFGASNTVYQVPCDKTPVIFD